MKYAWLMLMFYFFSETWCWLPELKPIEVAAARQLLDMMKEVIKDTNQRIGHLSVIKQDSDRRASFEIGYLTYILQEKYRRMIDKYNVASFMLYRFFVSEFVLLLGEVEHHYWEIEHILNMLHEIEAKYKIKGDLDQDYEVPTTTETPTAATRPKIKWHTRTKMKSKHFNQYKYIMGKLSSTMPTPNKSRYWPIEYGWEINYYW